MATARSPMHRADTTKALLVGAAVGVVSGLFGIGGGALLIVGLLWIGFTQHQAHATSLAAMVLTAAAALVPFALAGEVAIEGALVLAPTAMAGAYFGAGLMRRIPEDRLRVVFAIFLLLIAARMLVGVDVDPGPGPIGPAALAGMAALGLATGVLSGVLGIGGGLIMIPVLVLVFGFGQHAAEGTSLAVVIPTALMGAARHTRSGYTDWRRGALLGSAGILGGLGGANVALALDGIALQRMFAVFLILMTLRLLRKRSPPSSDASGASDEPPDPPDEPPAAPSR